MVKGITAITAAMVLSSFAAGQTIYGSTITNQISSVNPVAYYNTKTNASGAVVLTRVDTFKKLGLDLSWVLGVTTTNYSLFGKSGSLESLVGTTGFALTGSWTVPATKYFVTAGVAVTWDSGKQLGEGVIFTIGEKF